MSDAAIGILDKYGVNVLVIVGALWFIKYMFDRFMSMLDDERKARESEKEAHSEEMLRQVEALNNNTIVMKQILEVMRGNDANISE